MSLQQQHNHVHPEVLPTTVVMAVKKRRDDDGNALRVFSKEPTPQKLNAPAFFSSLLRRSFDWIKGGGSGNLMSLNIVRGPTKAIKRGLNTNTES